MSVSVGVILVWMSLVGAIGMTTMIAKSKTGPGPLLAAILINLAFYGWMISTILHLALK